VLTLYIQTKARSIFLHTQTLPDKHPICTHTNQIPRAGTRKQMTSKD